MPVFQNERDRASLFYRYYIPSSSPHRPASTVVRQPLTLVFLHGWPMSSRMYDQLIVPLVETHRFPVIAPDRRGFGNSDWATSLTGEVTFDTFVEDAVALLEHVMQRNPGPFVFVGASMGTAESVLAHSASEFLREHCRGFVWIGPNMPYPVRCDESPEAMEAEQWEGLIQSFRGAGGKDFILEAIPGVFRLDLGNTVGQSTLRFFERLVWQVDPVALERTAVILQKSMGAELKEMAKVAAADEKNKVPILILHGDSDAGMPLKTSAAVVHELLPWSQLKVYEKAGHGKFLSPDTILRDKEA
ncbi:alpha/beta-hydrolase [Parathielavia appendiculata]|uniref:Alpha/beta-hydrolase n=1 Tax=Parathielavia appendiculata TaxID=2587402 RepID=A0AAN6Z0T0_9PEZI|nr:alpha/beta-hydrolase [Parathielavia appendiculata]